MSPRDQLSDYLLGELGADERARFEAELAGNRELAAEVERLRPVVTQLEALDPAVWDAPGLAVPALPRLPAERPGAAPWWRRPLVLRPLPVAALATTVLALGVGAGLLVAGDDGSGDVTGGGRVISLAPVEPLGGRAAGTATIAPSGERARVHLTGLRPNRKGEYYELWLLNSPDDLVSLGSFRVPASGEVDVSVPVPGDAGSFAALDVSVEPGDGNPAHSSRSVLRAPLESS